jgi:(p)ppGpp synthase/HD superfamily hydrolase
MSFSQDLYLKALNFAARAHGEQKTPMGFPYIVHVSSVAMEVMAALRVGRAARRIWRCVRAAHDA